MPNVGVLSVAEDIAERPMRTVDTEVPGRREVLRYAQDDRIVQGIFCWT